MTVKLCSASNRATGVRVTSTGLWTFPACRAVLRVITTVIASNNEGLTMRYSGRGQQTGGCREWAWTRRSVAGIGLPVSPERGERRESSSALPAALVCPGPDGGAVGRGLSRFFGRLRLQTMRRAGVGRASAAIPGTGGRTGALARSWRRGAAVLLLAFAGLLALPLQAQAQKTTFVSNTGQSTASSLRGIGPTFGSFFYSQAQQFSTGSNEGGYTLSAIKVQADSFASNSSPKVSIYTASAGGNPGTSLYVLTNPATLNGDAINTFRAPANATLEKDTDYFVVFEATGSGSNIRYDLKGTISANEDSGTASGWSIADTSRERATNSGNWSSVFARLKIAVTETIPPSISIADASAAENAGHLLFDVTLSRSSPNTVKVDFETISGGTATEGVDYYARRTYTHVILAGDKTAQMGFALIEDTVAAAGETVKVKLSNARVVDAYGDKIKDLDITTDEATGTITAPPTTTTTVPNLTIGIRDATGDEDDGWLDFRVRLSRKYTDLVCYDFETISGGTAEEGRDYLKFPKAMYWMQIGKRVDKPFVRIIDDSVSDSGETVKVKISNARLCDDASKTVTINRAEATGTITNHDPLPRAGLPPLTASFSSVPGEHDGSSAFTFRVAFSADLNISYVTLRDQALTVSGGTAKKARRVDGRKDLWELTVKPSGTGAVTVRLPAGSLETSDGRGLERSVSATIAGPVGITVDDAEVREAPGAVLAFTVSLSRAASGSVRVDYATSDGTAAAGSDYTARSGTLTFTAGETSKTVSVPVLDDAHDDGGETLTLTLSNASGARIDDARATGTINNDDPLQRAWLARFGRTAAEHVLDGVQARLSAPRNAGMEASLAGQSIRGRAFETVPEQYAAMHAHDGAAAWDGLESFSHWMANGIDEAGIGGSMAGRMNARNDAADSGSAMAGRMSGRNLMMGSAFALTADMEGDSSVAVWGRGAYSGFSGQAHDVALEGEVATAMLGTDYAAGPWIAGLSLSFSEGDGTYRLDGREGALNSSVTGLYPYVGYEITDRLSAWGVAGYGRGDMTLTLLDSTEAIRTDIGLTMGAMGARGELVPRTAAAGFGLAVTSDVLVVSTTSDAAAGMAAADAAVSRLRLGLDGSWLVQFDGGASITPSFEIGMRNDGGDAETGFGVDIGGGLAFANAQSGFGFEVNARGLLAHEDSDFSEWGVSGAFRFDPNPSSELGLSLSVGPSWGASPTGGVNALLGRETMTGVALDGATPQGGRLGTEAAWGFPAFGGRYTGTPYLGLGLTEAGRDYRFGWRLGAVDIEALELSLGLEGTRRESGGRPPVHGAMLLSSLRW